MNKRSLIKEMVLKVAAVFVILQSLGIILFILFLPEFLKNIPYIIIYEIISLLFILIILTNLFKRSLTEINKVVNELGAGNIYSILPETGYVETEELRQSINSLFEHLRNIFKRSSEGLRQTVTGIKKVGLSFETLSDVIKKQTELLRMIEASIKKADNYRREIIGSDQKSLSVLSEDNITALTQITSSGREIEESTKQLFEFSTDIHSVILDISKAAKEIAKSMENLSVSVEQTSVAVDELTASFKEIERSTKESANLTKDVRHIAADGMNTIAEAMDGMDKIVESVNKNVEMIKRLSEKSIEIEKILSVISDITKKTNLLSLNAAILSSQAGEEGKVFSVVADEIKVLADKTRSSAKEITEIIKSTQKDIETTINASGESLKTVEQGTALVIKAGEALREVINIARQSADAANTIQKATHEQVMGISQINKSMEIIKTSLEDVTKSAFIQEKGSRNILNTSERIKEMSSNLTRGIGEQNIGVQMILRNIQTASEKTKHIDKEIQEYEQSDKEVLEAINGLNELSKELSKTIQDINNSSNRLYKEASEYLKGLEGFISG